MATRKQPTPEGTGTHRTIPDPLQAILTEEALRLEQAKDDATSRKYPHEMEVRLQDLKQAVRAIGRKKP